jgi:hypothetical protein
MYEDRQYMIFNVSELDNINFDTVLETSSQTVRKSVDGSKTFVKWSGQMPECVANLTTKEGPYNHDQMLALLNDSEWTSPMVENE